MRREEEKRPKREEREAKDEVEEVGEGRVFFEILLFL